MIVGYLKSAVSSDEMGDEISALEDAGCERIVLDSSYSEGPGADMLRAVINRLDDGDGLVVWSLDSVANTMASLVELILQLDGRNIQFRSLKEGFDSHGQHRSVLRATFQQLRQFERQVEARHREERRGRRVGRPRALSEEDVDRARRLLKEGRVMDDVARELNVSRATLYRYIEQSRPEPRGRD